MVAIVIIIAGINVKLNDSTNPVGLSLRNLEALSNNECGGCNYTLMPRSCYKADDITPHPQEPLRDLCPNAGDICPGTTKRGCINGPTYVCHFKNYH
jgi:hypothetical protein